MSQELFRRLIARAEIDGTPLRDRSQNRWIERLSVGDADLMATADVEALALSRQVRAARVSHHDRVYFIFFGFGPPTDSVLGLSSVDATPGLFALAVLHLDIAATATPWAIREAVEAFHAGVGGYSGHGLAQIMPLFPELRFFSADVNFPFTTDIIRATGSYASRTYADGPLAFEDETCETLATSFEAGHATIPHMLVLQGVLSFSWASLYLEIYRCIEQLFAVPRISALVKEWPSNLALYDVAELVERHLSWRPREDESLAKILRNCDSGSVDIALDAFGCSPSEVEDQRVGQVARSIYGLRNQLVHFRPHKDVPTRNDQSWNLIIRAMLLCVFEIYDAVGAAFHDAPDVVEKEIEAMAT